MNRPHGRDLRRGRYSENGRIYLVTFVCHERKPTLADVNAGRCVVKALRAVVPEAETLCYVVMPDHVHWLLQLKEGAQLPTTVQKVKSLSSKALRRACPAEGHRWQRGFHDRALRKDENLVAAARYVVANPLRAGIAKSLRTYPLWDAKWL